MTGEHGTPPPSDKKPAESPREFLARDGFAGLSFDQITAALDSWREGDFVKPDGTAIDLETTRERCRAIPILLNTTEIAMKVRFELLQALAGKISRTGGLRKRLEELVAERMAGTMVQ